MLCSRGVKIILICLCAVLLECTANGGARIMGGDINSVHNVPYIVQLRNQLGLFYCGGTLVSSRHVVTAAHCVDSMPKENIFIYGGISSIYGKGEKHEIEQLFIAPGYTRVSKNMDIAVIKLRTEITGKNIKPMALCSKSLQSGSMIQVSGWGKTSEDGHVSELLRSADMTILPRDDCVRKHVRLRTKITESMVCAHVPGIKDACAGDSGGPAILDGELCGVVSWGIGCGRRNYPGIYTDVGLARKFIEDAMQK